MENEATAEVEVAPGIMLWYRIWGNRESGIPVLFVHGGPGACTSDYTNSVFFEADRYFVVEIDQRGTGNSKPSVRENFENMKVYLDITIQQMSADFEVVRETLGIQKWLVFGGSWGSTLGLDYAERYPERCIGVILRGIFLSTKDEFDAIYARDSFQGNMRRTAEFDVFFEAAQEEVKRLEEPELDPNDSERFIRIYEQMMLRGDRNAIWRFYVFENNLIEEEQEKMMDPLVISEAEYPEAMSTSFFEARLFLKHTFEEPLDLLGNVTALKALPTWVCQGLGDEVCPERFAKDLVDRLAEVGVTHTAKFVDSGHKASSNGMTEALKESVDEFYAIYSNK